jgi:hypothetical protein
MKVSGKCCTDYPTNRPASSPRLGWMWTPNSFRIGVRVLVFDYNGCDHCDYCRSGWTQMCDHRAIMYVLIGHGYARGDILSLAAQRSRAGPESRRLGASGYQRPRHPCGVRTRPGRPGRQLNSRAPWELR